MIIFDQQRQRVTGNFRSTAVVDAMIEVSIASLRASEYCSTLGILPINDDGCRKLNRIYEYLDNELDFTRDNERYQVVS